MASEDGKKRILLVEDEPATRALLRSILETDGYEILEASNGNAGAELAVKQRPDLVIMDIMLPGISGYEATQTLRANPKTKHIPIMMCTAKDTMGDVEKSLAVGANDYISKPLDMARFRTKIQKLLGSAGGPGGPA